MTPAEPLWRKSSRSGSGTQSDCVEVAALDGLVGIRDSKAPSEGHLSIPREGLGGLLRRIKAGALDL